MSGDRPADTTTGWPLEPLSSSARPVQRPDTSRVSDLLPLGDWYRHHSLRSWPVQLFLALICVPSIALFVVGANATQTTFDAGAWIFAAYFAIAWLLLLGVIIRPAHVTRVMLLVVTVLSLLTQVPLAVALETALHATNASLLPSIITIGIPEELAKALPVLVVALIYRRSHGLVPRDYLFVGAVSGLVFGASEVVRYFTINGVAEFYQTVKASIPQIQALLSSGHQAATSIFAALIGPVLLFILNFVWRFVTDPISHACWAGLTGYFIGLAATGRYRWYQVAWIGLVVAAILHGLNDWTRVNGHWSWILVTLVSGILFLGYAKVGSRDDLRLTGGDVPEFLLPHAAHPDAVPPRAPESVANRRGRPWWEH
jgi:RsiW-degrading membrane proteinase PrsW (M82 family)